MPIQTTEPPEPTGQSNFVNTESTDCKTCGENLATCADLKFEQPPGVCCDGCAHGGGVEDEHPEEGMLWIRDELEEYREPDEPSTAMKGTVTDVI